MKATTIIAAATAAAAPGAAALSRTHDNPADMVESRDLFKQEKDSGGLDTIVFDECMHKPLPTCRGVIMQAIRGNPNLFGFSPSDVKFEGTPVRSETDELYYVVFVKTDYETGTLAAGVAGDGMIYYPYEWSVSGQAPYKFDAWDCAPGDEFLTWEACCDLITTGVPTDVNGNTLQCEPSHPVGSPDNPRVPGRIIIHVDESNNVAHPPRVE